MTRRHTRQLAVSVFLILATGVASAATQYVSDQLAVNLRRGPGTGYAIISLVDAGTKVQTLSTTNGWTEVRTASGETGYVLTRLLSDQPAAADRLAQFESENQRLQKKVQTLTQSSDSAQSKLAGLKEQVQKLREKNRQLAQKLEEIRAVSADAVRINKKNKKLRQNLMTLQSKVERLENENQLRESRRTGMKIGALILFVGIVVGLLLSLLRKRRSSNWDSF